MRPPAWSSLVSAYAFLLQAILDRRARRVFDFASLYYSEQLYQGYGEDLGSTMVKDVIAKTAELATGTVTVEVYKGNVFFVSLVDVPHSTYVLEHASMDDDQLTGDMGDTIPIGYDHKDSEGFLRVLGLGATTIGQAGQVSSKL